MIVDVEVIAGWESFSRDDRGGAALGGDLEKARGQDGSTGGSATRSEGKESHLDLGLRLIYVLAYYDR